MSGGKKSKAYGTTAITVEKSQGSIQEILRKHGAQGVQWTWEGHDTMLRFIWDHEGSPVSARFMLTVPEPDVSDVDRKHRAGRKGRHEIVDTLRRQEAQRLHRVLHWYLKSVFEAQEAGLLSASEAFLGWLEDSEGVTVSERLLPGIGKLGETKLKALGPKRSSTPA